MNSCKRVQPPSGVVPSAIRLMVPGCEADGRSCKLHWPRGKDAVRSWFPGTGLG
jgi:hypothetical protein